MASYTIKRIYRVVWGKVLKKGQHLYKFEARRSSEKSYLITAKIMEKTQFWYYDENPVTFSPIKLDIGTLIDNDIYLGNLKNIK